MPRRTPLTAEFDATVLAAALPRHVCAGHMRYRNFEFLAQGGKAEVYRCVDGVLGREVAFKLLLRRLGELPIEQQLLVREARVMAALRHPSIPAVYDLGRDPDGRPYFAMGLKIGPTLHDMLSALRRNDPVVARTYDLERLVGVILKIGTALEYAHAMNVVHCDLKPENIILEAGDAVSLVDWGLAIVDDYAEGADANPAVRQRGCQGSALYMAPEQAAGDHFLGAGVDVYGLGALLYECLTLDTPCRGATTAETLRNVREREPVAPRVVAAGREIPHDLEQVCLTALAKAPHERFASMGQLCEALRDCHTDILLNFERSNAVTRGESLWLGAWNDPYDARRATQRHCVEADEYFLA